MKPLTRRNLARLLGCQVHELPPVIRLTRDGLTVGHLEAPAGGGPGAHYRLAGTAPSTATAYHANLPAGAVSGPWSN